MKKGWFQVGFIKDFESPVSAIETADGPLMVINTGGRLRVYPAVCPHRGANLGIGGRLLNESVRCPFHGCSIGLDRISKEGYRLDQVTSRQTDSLLFATFAPETDLGFTEFMTNFIEENIIIPGFRMEVKTKPEMVIENAFDQMHFRTVHSILNEPRFEIVPSVRGEYSITGTFHLPPSPWQASAAAEIAVPYEAKAFSPYLVVSTLKGENPYHIITASREISPGRSLIALSIAVSYQRFDPGELALYQYLIDKSSEGLKSDQVIWENMTDSPQRLQRREKSVIGFQAFCRFFDD